MSKEETMVGVTIAGDAVLDIAETGGVSRAWNRREFIAKQLARQDGKSWNHLPNVSTLWFRDKMHYRAMADRAEMAARQWDTFRSYDAMLSKAKEGTGE